MNLPNEFYECMKATLGIDYDEYEGSLTRPPFRGLRVNTLLCEDKPLLEGLKISAEKTPFYEHGYYISNEITGLGNHPLHHAGGFYLQEPSAMSAVTALDVQPGQRVLDLCAAPGGKSTQIAAALAGSGLLWANEIVPTRARILCSNLERLGVINSVVSCASPELLCPELTGYFDRVLVDAPCSGEGMLRREPNASAEWQLSNRAACAARDEKILDSAAVSLKGGGYMVYSTCTLSGEENEQTIAEFLKRHPEFSIESITARFGRPAYARLCDNERLTMARRILPADGGEGHFVALLRKNDDTPPTACTYQPDTVKNEAFLSFMKQSFVNVTHKAALLNNVIYLVPEYMPQTKHIHILRAGVPAGCVKKDRFEPSHALYAAFVSQSTLNLPPESPEIAAFLRGEEIACDKNGYVGITCLGIPCGFGKASGGRLKNHYPKGLRVKR